MSVLYRIAQVIYYLAIGWFADAILIVLIGPGHPTINALLCGLIGICIGYLSSMAGQ